MTALAGFWSFGGAEAAGPCERMLKAQQVYAPDPAVVRGDKDVALGRRLFRLLPEDAFDRGPVVDGNMILVADVRLDNRADLGRDLAIDAGEAATLSDSSFLLRFLRERGEEGVDRLVGDFAFALWDGARERLLLCRDYLGQRPLHYHRGDGFFAFASMPKGLHALPEIPVAPDRGAATDFLALIPESGRESFFEGIEKVPPGHLAIVSKAGVETRRYWTPPTRSLSLRTPADYAEAMREQLDAAVAARLRGVGGRVAAQLSGGFDSGAVTSTAARLLAREGGRVTAFTAVPRPGYEGGLRNAISDEGPLAAAVARLHPNIDHVQIAAGGRSPLAALDRYFFLFERPVLNLCNFVWADAILEEARARKLNVLLSGSMGNWSISYHGMHLLPDLLLSGRWFRLAREIALLLKHGARAGTIAAQTIGPFLPTTAWDAISRLRGKAVGLSEYSAINPATALEQDIMGRAASRGLDPHYRPRRGAAATRAWAIGRVDRANYGKGILGGWGIDVRDPTADRRLMEFCLSVPADQFLRDGMPRALAREAFADRLPPEVLRQRRKGYQAVDWHEGLTAAADEVRDEVRKLAETPLAAATLDTERMARLVEDWPEGGWHSDRITGFYRHALLRGVSAGHFLRKASGSNR